MCRQQDKFPAAYTQIRQTVVVLFSCVFSNVVCPVFATLEVSSFFVTEVPCLPGYSVVNLMYIGPCIIVIVEE